METQMALFGFGGSNSAIDELSRVLGASSSIASQQSPPYEIGISDRKLVVKFIVPGIDKDTVDVTIHDKYVELYGMRKKDDKLAVELSEFYYGKVYRTAPLSQRVDRNSASVSYSDGILTLSMDLLPVNPPTAVRVKLG
jgi:HSP20 family molecular chaperone IbpA